MLRRQLVRRTKELEAEQIGRLKLKLSVKNKEIKALKSRLESRADKVHEDRNATEKNQGCAVSVMNKYSATTTPTAPSGRHGSRGSMGALAPPKKCKNFI